MYTCAIFVASRVRPLAELVFAHVGRLSMSKPRCATSTRSTLATRPRLASASSSPPTRHSRDRPGALRLRARWGVRHLELAAVGVPAIIVALVAATAIARTAI
jgi:hypothetical protein